jgi:glycine cleavage system H protein
LINQDPYGEGWIAVLELADLSEYEQLLDAKAYQQLLEEEA